MGCSAGLTNTRRPHVARCGRKVRPGLRPRRLTQDQQKCDQNLHMPWSEWRRRRNLNPREGQWRGPALRPCTRDCHRSPRWVVDVSRLLGAGRRRIPHRATRVRRDPCGHRRPYRIVHACKQLHDAYEPAMANRPLEGRAGARRGRGRLHRDAHPVIGGPGGVRSPSRSAQPSLGSSFATSGRRREESGHASA